MDTWGRYKEIYRLTDHALIRKELWTACTPELNRLLFDPLAAEMLNCATEEQLSRQIRLCRDQGYHKEVHQQNFYSMRQKEGGVDYAFLAKFNRHLSQWTKLWSADKLLQRYDGQKNGGRTHLHGTPKQNIGRSCNPHNAAAEVWQSNQPENDWPVHPPFQ